MNSIDRYMARLIAVPLISTLVISAMLLVLDRMLRLFEFVATEGGPISAVWRMLANLLPEYLGLGIPIGLMLGILLAFRRLATSSELDVLRAVGLSYTRLLKVPFMFAIALALMNLAIVGFLQPWARYNYEQLRFELRTGALGASIKVGEFTNFGNRMTLRIEDSQKGGTDLSGIFVHMTTNDGGWYSVSAQRGTFLRTDNPDEIIFQLTNGTLIQKSKDSPVPRVLTFSTHNLPIPLPKYEPFRVRGGRNLELTLPELAVSGRNPAEKPEVRITSRAAFHYRVVEICSMFLLPFLAAALGIPPKRSTSALGVFLSIVMIVTYHKINEYGQAIGSLGKIDPIIAMWVPFAIFAGLVFWMYHQVANVPGGQPIGALEKWFSVAIKTIARYIPGLKRKPVEVTGVNLLSFFPSRTISLYMGKMFVIRTFAVLATFLVVLQSLDLLSESGKILAIPGNGDAEIWRYIGLRLPQIVQTFLPFSVLMGTIITLSQLNQNSEVISLKASGLSAHQVLAPLVLTGFVVALISFSFNDRIVTRATAALDAWKKVEYQKVPIDTGNRTNVWVRSGDNLIEVNQIHGRGEAAVLDGVTVHERDKQTRLVAIVTGTQARREGQGWRLTDTRRFDVASGKMAVLGTAHVADGVRPDQFTLSKVDEDGLSFFALAQAIDDLKQAGRPTKALEGSMWHKLSGPLSSILMPLLGAVAAFGLARSGKLFVRAVIGMALGFLYFVGDNFALAMGNLGAYPPWLAAFGPFLLFLAIGEAVLIKTEE